MKKLIVAVLLGASALPANAAVVTFDNLAFQGNTSVLSAGGLTFTNPNQAHYFYYSGEGGVDNGTDYYMYAFGNTTVTKTDGSAFDLASMDLGRAFGPWNGSVSYLLNLADGGTEDGIFAINGMFQTLTINKSITSLLLYNMGDYVAIDNITYDEAPEVDVAEPAMLSLFGLGALGLGLVRRRRRRA